MEEVLDTYALPYDPQQPVVCFDEKSYQLLDHLHPPMPLCQDIRHGSITSTGGVAR